jgi:hypothetical protein
VLCKPGALEPQGFAVLHLLGDLFDEAPRHGIFRPRQVGALVQFDGAVFSLLK